MPSLLCQHPCAASVWLEAMIVKVFGDESSDEQAQRVFAVSGVIGTEDEWLDAKKKWAERTVGRPFHAAHCESEYAHDPNSPEHHGNLRLYKDLTELLAQSRLDGIGVSLDLQAFRDLFPDSLADVGYFHCLAGVLEWITQWARNYNASLSGQPQDDPVCLEFTFDSRAQSNGSTGSLYSAFINQPELSEKSEFLGSKISFDCRTNPRIQIADLLARESMKELNRRLTGTPPNVRRSYQTLADTGRFNFVHNDRAFCEQWKRDRTQIEHATGMNEADYAQWLVNRGRVQNGKPHDNWVNRMEYFEWRKSSHIAN